jgi:hypothetical protein
MLKHCDQDGLLSASHLQASSQVWALTTGTPRARANSSFRERDSLPGRATTHYCYHHNHYHHCHHHHKYHHPHHRQHAGSEPPLQTLLVAAVHGMSCKQSPGLPLGTMAPNGCNRPCDQEPHIPPSHPNISGIGGTGKMNTNIIAMCTCRLAAAGQHHRANEHKTLLMPHAAWQDSNDACAANKKTTHCRLLKPQIVLLPTGTLRCVLSMPCHEILPSCATR